MARHPTRSGAGHGILVAAALVACCAAPLLISASVIAVVGALPSNPIAIVAATVLVTAAVFYALYRRRRRAAVCGPPDVDTASRCGEQGQCWPLRAEGTADPESTPRASRRLLATTKSSVYEIALLVGYDNDASLAKAFKREFGLTPGQHRERASAAPVLAVRDTVQLSGH